MLQLPSWPVRSSVEDGRRLPHMCAHTSFGTKRSSHTRLPDRIKQAAWCKLLRTRRATYRSGRGPGGGAAIELDRGDTEGCTESSYQVLPAGIAVCRSFRQCPQHNLLCREGQIWSHSTG